MFCLCLVSLSYTNKRTEGEQLLKYTATPFPKNESGRYGKDIITIYLVPW